MRPPRPPRACARLLAGVLAVVLAAWLPAFAPRGFAAGPPAASGSSDQTDSAAHRGFVASMLARITGGEVQVQGLSGSFPSEISIRRTELHDAQGAWAVIDNLDLHWSPLRLVFREVLINRATATQVHVLRRPASSSSSKSSSSSWFVQLVVDKLHVDRFQLDPAVAGAAAALALDGTAHLQGSEKGDLDLTAKGLDNPGTYALKATLDPKAITLDTTVQEAAGGPVARIIRLPDLGGLDLHATLNGPKTAEQTALTLAAGQLHADAHGTLDLDNSSADLDVTASAPAMQPRPDLAWQDLALKAHVTGPFSAPTANGQLRIDALEAGGAAVRTLTADVQGDQGKVALRAVLDGVQIPGGNPDLLAAAPLRFDADADLKAADRPIRFDLEHPLMSVKGSAQTAGTLAAALDVSLPQLGPLAAVAQYDVQGHTAVSLRAQQTPDGSMNVAVQGQLGITGGMAPLPGLIGPDGRIAANATIDGMNLAVNDAEVQGRTLQASVHGTDRDGALDFTYAVNLADLSVLTPRFLGHLAIQGHVQGPRGTLAVQTTVQGDLGTKGFAPAPIQASIVADGLPHSPTGRVQVQGTLEDAPLILDASVRHDADGNLHAEIARAAWKSAQANGQFELPAGTRLPLGKLSLSLPHLEEFRPLTGLDLSGSVAATIDIAEANGQPQANVQAQVRNAGLPGARIGAASLDAHLAGPLDALGGTGTLQIQDLAAGGAGVRSMTADLKGDRGDLTLRSVLDGLRIPGGNPDVLAGAPLHLDAEARLNAPDRPVRFTVSHPLIAAQGEAQTANALRATLNLTLPHLAPLASVAHYDVHGNAALAVQLARDGTETSAQAQGTVAVTGGAAPLPGLIGKDGRIALAATMNGGTVTVSQAEITGATLHAALHGTDDNGALDVAYAVDLSDLSALSPRFLGQLAVQGTVQGRRDSLAVQARAQGTLATKGYRPAPIEASIQAEGLPSRPTGHVQAQGTLDGSPLRLDVSAERVNGVLQARIAQAEWKSARAQGQFTLPPASRIPLGHLDLRLPNLAEFQPLIGRPITGSVIATVDVTRTNGQERARVDARIRDAGMSGTRIGTATLTGTATDLLAHPVVDARLDASGITAAGVSGAAARVGLKGRDTALAVDLSASAADLAGHPAHVAGTATVDVPARAVTLRTLRADWRGAPATLLGPAVIRAKPGIAVQHLRLGVQGAVLEVNGTASPALNLDVALRNVTPALLQPFAPTLHAAGVVDGTAHLTGSLSRPTGTVRVAGRGLRVTTGPGAALPPATLTAALDLQGTQARVNVALAVGTTHLNLAGTAPLSRTGALDLRATGAVNLALTDPVLTAIGRRARGIVTIDLTVTGTAAAPRAGGTVRLAGGAVEDYAQGIHITDMAATLRAEGDTLRLVSLTGRAGPGTVAAAGTVGILAPDMPVDIRLTANNARPVASNLVTAAISADITARGRLQGQVLVAGVVRVLNAEITVPSSLPTSVAVLKVVRPGQTQPAPTHPPLTIALDLTIQAPGQIFVRGHGLDAELGGTLHLGGTSTHLLPSGGLALRRGQFSLAGKTLNFTRGRISFNGGATSGKIDPALDFEANSTSNGITALLTIGGYASAPTFRLSSIPPLPQDQILAQLLFGESIKDLSPFQIAAIAQALAELTGNGGGFDPLNTIRSGLGLDRLTIGTGANGATTLEAGRYVANGIYVGAKQSASGASETQAQVQIDITKHLKLETDAGAGRGANSVGLTYQFNY